MIQTKKELEFYILADRIMAGLPDCASTKEWIANFLKELLGIYQTSEYLKAMRKYAYYFNVNKKTLTGRAKRAYWKYRYVKLGQKLGFTIGFNAFGYGLLIPHDGTIVVNGHCRIDNFAVLHTCTCIGGIGKQIGDALYLATGAQIMRPLTLGDNVMVGANSLVNKSFDSGVLLVGSPAEIKKQNLKPWYEEQGSPWKERAEKIKSVYENRFKINQ